MIRKSVTLAAVAALTMSALATPTLARPRDGDRYADRAYGQDDACRDEKAKKRDTGRVLGALAGAVIGSQVAGRGSRTEGAVVGAVAGAAVGGEVGRKSAKSGDVCDSDGYAERRDDRYGGDGRYDRRNDRYDGRYDGRYADRRDANERCYWTRDRQGRRVQVC